MVMVLSACSSPGADSTDPGGSGRDGDKSPLEKYIGAGGPMVGGGEMAFAISAGGAEPSEAERQERRQVEEEVAACMRAEGFEYVPVSPDDQDPEEEFDDSFSLDPDEFAKRYGYGISTLGPGDSADEEDDPNVKIRAALSPQAQKAYDEALYGADGGMVHGSVIVSGEAGEAGESGEAAPDATDGKATEQGPSGCVGTAHEKILGKPDEANTVDFREFESLFEDITSLRERIERDPRVAKATRDWADCMAAAGYDDFENPEAAQESVMKRMSDVYGRDEDGSDSGDGPQTTEIGPDSADPKKLAKLRDYELAVAKADFACRDGEYENTHKDVSYDLEAEFVEQHRAELERYRDAMAKAADR